MIGALAVLGIREDGGWHQATEYTTNYSAVIKVAKMFVVYQAWLERQDEVAELTATKGAEAAYEEASSVFHLVRDKVRRFMTRMPGRPDDEPRVMNWIYDARTYGMHIRFNTVAPGMVDWSGDRISFRRVQVRPARAPELAGIRHSNTANGGVRNVFAHDGMICFVTSYHKNYRQTGTAKVIHRYLPREVGELLVWYLWGDERRNNTKDNDARDNTEDDDARDNTITDESANATPGRAPWTDERLWTSDKARRIMQQHSERLVGSKINISGWRHMAVAIANRYLNEAFGRADDRNNDNDDNDDDDVGVEDSALDLQAGHGTHVAGMIYGRLYQEAPFGTAALRDRFRAVSRQWH
ncbi:hypothetical protein CGMCC3_g18121, partial [Colletotrichum fructicola]